MLGRAFPFLGALLAACFASLVLAQSIPPGFPPGTFQSRAPLDAGSAPSEATVLVDVNGFITTPSSQGVITTNWSSIAPVNVGSGPNGTSNMVLMAELFLCGQAAGTSSSPSLIWDNGGTNQSMTKLTLQGGADHIGNGNAGDIYMFALLSPTLGSKTFLGSWTGANQAILAAASFVNVDQTGGSTTFPSAPTATGASSVATVPISTTPTTRKFLGAFAGVTNFTTTGNTALTNSPNTSCNLGAAAGNLDAGTVTSLSYSPSNSTWAAAGVVIKGH